LNSLKFIFWY